MLGYKGGSCRVDGLKEADEEVGDCALGSGWGQSRVGLAELGAEEAAAEVGECALGSVWGRVRRAELRVKKADEEEGECALG